MRLFRLRPSALLALIMLTFAAGQSIADDSAATRQQIDALNKKIKQLKTSMEENQSDRSRAAKRLQSTEQEIGELAAKLHRTREKRDQQQQKLNTLRQRQTTLQGQQKQQQALIAQQLKKAYTLNQETPLKMLLNQEQPDTLTRNMTYYDYFNRARSEKIAKYRSTLEELERLVPAIEDETAALAETQRELENQQADLRKQQQRRKEDIAKLDKELSSQKGSLGKMDKERAALENVLTSIRREVANFSIPATHKPFKDMRGQMPWPVTGRQLNLFGSSRQGSAVTWQGVQIAGEEGDKVRAIHNGRVVFADWLRGTGLLIIIDHGGDYLSLYGHNQSLLRQEGDWVRAGDTIATLGNSGGKRQAGVYFEVRHKGRPVNPGIWCK